MGTERSAGTAESWKTALGKVATPHVRHCDSESLIPPAPEAQNTRGVGAYGRGPEDLGEVDSWFERAFPY
jgi:hypothetical protein